MLVRTPCSSDIFFITENYFYPELQSWKYLDWEQSKYIDTNATKQHSKVPTVTSSGRASQSFWSSSAICIGADHSLPQAHLVLWERCTKFLHWIPQPHVGTQQGGTKHENASDFLADSHDHRSTGFDTKLLRRSTAGTQIDFWGWKESGAASLLSLISSAKKMQTWMKRWSVVFSTDTYPITGHPKPLQDLFQRQLI